MAQNDPTDLWRFDPRKATLDELRAFHEHHRRIHSMYAKVTKALVEARERIEVLERLVAAPFRASERKLVEDRSAKEQDEALAPWRADPPRDWRASVAYWTEHGCPRMAEAAQYMVDLDEREAQRRKT